MRGKLIAIILIIYLVVLFTGCESRQTFTEGTTAVNTPTPPIDRQIKLIDNGPEQGGTLTLFTTTVDDLNPYRTKNRFVTHIASFVFESLFIQTEENKVEPWLIKEWSQENYTNWFFVLNDSVYFHHGPELTSYDIRHTLRVLESSNTGFFDKNFIGNIKELNIITSRQFEIILKEPDRSFISKLTFPVFSQSVESVNENSLYGTGAYCFYTMSEDEIVLERNDNWWYEEPPYIDSVVFKVYPENNMLDAFQNNEIDIAFIKNVDFSKYQYRTDLFYQVYPDNEGNFLYVNPDSLFGQLNRQKALFGYIINRIHDMNLGQVQYFDEYNSEPLTLEEFKDAMVQSGLSWNTTRGVYTYKGVQIGKITVLVPEKDMQKLHTANFLVNILADAGITAEIKTLSAQGVTNAIRNGNYDLSPITEELKQWEDLTDTIHRMQEKLGYGRENYYILPLYRNQQATLFKNVIRGEKKSVYWNPYQGFYAWYIPAFKDDTNKNQ